MARTKASTKARKTTARTEKRTAEKTTKTSPIKEGKKPAVKKAVLKGNTPPKADKSAKVLYTCYFGEEFQEVYADAVVFDDPTCSLKQFPGAPAGTKEKITSWLDQKYGPVCSNEEATMMLSMFEHGDAKAWNLANGKCVVIAKVGEFSPRKKDDTTERMETTADSFFADDGISADSFFAEEEEDEDKESNGKLPNKEEWGNVANAETRKTAVLTIGKTEFTMELEKVEGGWSLNEICPLPIGNFTIPDKIDGNDIVRIGHSLCRYAKELISIAIPDTVTEIKGQVFYGAFSGCPKLEKVKLSKKLKILGSGTFGDCTSLRDIELPDSIITLGSYVFADSSLKSIKMPNGLAEINSHLFENCSALERVEFQEGLVEAWNDIFKNCESLKEVVFPSSFDPGNLPTSMFRDCPKLKRVIFKVSKPEWVDEAEFLTDNFDGCPKVKVLFDEAGHSGNTGRQTKGAIKTNKPTTACKGKSTAAKAKNAAPITKVAKKLNVKGMGMGIESPRSGKNKTKTSRKKVVSTAKTNGRMSADDFFS